MKNTKILCLPLAICFALIGLLTGLELGFFREGSLMSRLDSSGYVEAVQTEIYESCVDYLEGAGCTAAVLDEYAEDDLPGSIRTDIIINLDGIYRGVWPPETKHFEDLRFYCEDEAAQFDKLPATPEEMEAFTAVEKACEYAYWDGVGAPLFPVLNRLVVWRDRRKWFWLAAVTAAVLLAKRLNDQKLLRRCALAAGVLPLVLGPVLRRALDYAAWITPDRRDHALYLSWMGAGFTALTVTGGLLLAGLLLWNLHEERKKLGKN